MKVPTSTPTMTSIKTRHDELYKWVLGDGQKLLPGDPEYEARRRDIDSLIHDIETLSGQVDLFEDYNWLNVAAVEWSVIFSSVLGVPRTIRIATPVRPLSAPMGPTLTNEEIDYIPRLAAAAERAAETFLASEILDGRINFAGRIAPRLYERLEKVWLKDVKRFRAFFLWLHRGNGIDTTGELGDYYAVCEHIRRMLVNPGMKARITEFSEAREYLEDRYLSKGIADLAKSGTRQLIEGKAYRICETTGEADSLNNWAKAETYVKMFYEKIIPAVLEADEESTLSVLKAFQFSKAGEERGKGYWIINCFETALAIYFLNPVTVEALWRRSEGTPPPESSVVSLVPSVRLIEREAYRIWERSHDTNAVRNWNRAEESVRSLLEGDRVPDALASRFVFSGRGVAFEGMMTETDRSKFVDAVRGQSTLEDAINFLFDQSRVIHRETTL